MAPGTLIQRNVRPKPVEDQSDDAGDSYDEESDVAPSIQSAGSESGDGSEATFNSEDESNEEVEEEESELGENDVEHQINRVSFGALLEAQEALSRKRKRGLDNTAEQEAKLEGIRARLREIRSQKESQQENVASKSKKRKSANGVSVEPPNSVSHGAGRSTGEHGTSSDDDNDSDSAPSEEGISAKSRTSKHAPASQSSKRQVTRKRTVVDVPKRTYRDPRFDALHQSQTQPGHSDKAYSFLRDYQKDEIAELKTAIRQTRNEEDKETLNRKLVSMENRLKSKDAKDRAQEVVRQHRKEEREKVQQGKRPYFLKRSELKERALVEKFKGMKSKDREKLMEKRKKKESQKEMRRMPNARRVTG